MTHENHVVPFASRMLPPPRGGGFRMDGYWAWCGSAIRGQDGRYHMFAARWPRELPFFEGYKCYSEVVRAVADAPAGPFRFAEVVLPDRGESHWDGRMTHNPTVLHHAGRYYLYYIGATFPGQKPPAEALRADPSSALLRAAYGSIRIGVAVAEQVQGPWRRLDAPVLHPRPGKWDHNITTNPAPCVGPDGRIMLIYRSNTPAGTRLGIAAARDPLGPFELLSDEPILADCHIEDPFVWWNGHCYELIAKDLSGKITGELHAGVHAVSEDAISWKLAADPRAWSRTMTWDDGQTVTLGSFERPQILLDRGKPACLYAATADGPGGFRNAENTWNMAVPLRCDAGPG